MERERDGERVRERKRERNRENERKKGGERERDRETAEGDLEVMITGELFLTQSCCDILISS